MIVIINRICAAITLAAVWLAVGSAHATLLVYEPFAYNSGNLNGQGATNTNGMTGNWIVSNVTGSPAVVTVHPEGNTSGVNFSSANGPNGFDGTYSNLPHTGGYVGSAPHPSDPNFNGNTTDHMLMHRALDSSVTATFVDGSTTWGSVVTARAFNANATAPRIAIGAGNLSGNRGHVATGEAIGVGGALNSYIYTLHAQVWDDSQVAGTYNVHNVNGVQVAEATPLPFPAADRFYWEIGSTSGTSTVTAGSAFANIIIFKIDWSDSGPDVISFARFLESDGAITEAMFNAASITSAGWTTQYNLDQSQFDTLSIAGGRYFIDEIRIATTFNEALGLNAGPAVPESSTIGLLAVGLLSAIAVASRRRRN